MADPLTIGLAILLTLVVVVLHYASGTGWESGEDISADVLEQRADAVRETDFPEPMNRAIGGGPAVSEGITSGEAAGELEDEQTESEWFDPSEIDEGEVEYYDIEYSKQGETIEVANDTHLLEAGEEQGWDLPYACREGRCLSCCARIPDGPAQDYIRHSYNEALNEEEMEQGYCLTCVAYPIAEFSLETAEQP